MEEHFQHIKAGSGLPFCSYRLNEVQHSSSILKLVEYVLGSLHIYFRRLTEIRRFIGTVLDDLDLGRSLRI